MALVMAGNGLAAQVAGSLGYTQAGAYKLQPGHALLFGANAGLLPHYQQLTATVYGEKRFLLNDLSLFEAGLALPAGAGAFGFQAAAFGSSDYNQSKIGLAYGRHLGGQLSLGVQFNYAHHHISGYGNAGSLTADAGLVYQIAGNLMAGLQLTQLAGTAFHYLKEESPQRAFEAGLGFMPSDAFFVSATARKATGEHISVRAAIQYKLLQKLLVTGGIETANTALYVGAGYQLGFVQLDAVAHWHPQLGISPGVMLTFKKEAN